MKIDRIEELRLQPGDEAQIAALLTRSFGEEFGGRSYFIQRHHLRFVARDSEIVGHMALTMREIRTPDGLFPVLGLADVATCPDRRDEGIASKLLKAAISEARQSPAEHLLLFGEAGLYAGQGFRAVDNPIRYILLEGQRSVGAEEGPSEGLMVLPLRGGSWDPFAPIDLLGHRF